MMLLFLLIITGFIDIVAPQTYSDVNNLLTDVFISKNYNRKIRPVIDQSGPIFIDASLYLFSVNEVDEVAEKLITTGFLTLSWEDELLKWNPTAYNNTNNVFLPQNDIWIPDLVLKNGFKKFEELGGSFYYLQVFHFGVVNWQPYQVFESRCSIDITYFPFDKQSCNITFIAWSHTVAEIDISKSSNGIQMYEYEENSVWTVLSTSSSIKKESAESEITFTINLQRKPLYYIMNIIIPIIFLGILNVLVFVIPADAGEKMSYSVTVFLAFAVFLTIVSTQLPVSSENTSILGMYLIAQLVFGVVALLITSLQLRLRHRSEKQTLGNGWVRVILIQRYLRCSKKNSHSSSSTVVMPLKGNELGSSICEQGTEIVDQSCDWNDASSSIDFFAFWLLLCANVTVSVIMYIYAAHLGSAS